MNDSKDKGGLSGSDLQQSQSGGGSGEYGGNQFQRQGGGRAGANESGTGGTGGAGGSGVSPGQSRGERYDEAQGGGRGPDSVSSAQGSDGISTFAREGGNGAPAADSDFERDQQAHQDRGQSAAEAEQD